jgi:hypothetical protein
LLGGDAEKSPPIDDVARTITPAVDKPPTHRTSLWMAPARFVV